MNKSTREMPVIRKAYSIVGFCDAYGLGKTKVYEEIKAGRLKSAKAGKRRMISVDAGDEWFASLTSAE